ncbi:hypothetical protein PHISCL_05255 [Aspergillus sclerotialis]|uniref:DNA-directed RNA polymerase III subunit n=1 Tax=Aspergillus sclerotialis TaxID=2070753 RepID=A0A3A2ZSV7_9EURO|nr:hypothetical protein PHISCL_05255 [Aspergillus sclerotialis]
MSRFGAKRGRKLPGQEFTWDNEPGAEPDTAPTPLFPKYAIPHARTLNPQEQVQVDFYRDLRERFHEGPDYSVLNTASTAARKGEAARANFDPFHGMQSYSGKYQKKQKTLPTLQGRRFILKFFPRELWRVIQPNYKAEAPVDGYLGQMKGAGLKRGFEDDELEEEEPFKRRRGGDDEEEAEGEEGGEKDILEEEEEEQEEEIVDDDFEDDEDEMGGDYNAEQYFDAGDDEYGDDGFADGGGGGGDEDTF